MTGLWLRRAFMAVTWCSAALLAGCGSSSVVSALTPTRFIGFGDAFTDLGAAGAGKYSVNDGSNNWVQQMAAGYGRSVNSVLSGGTSYARGNARVTSAVDAAGGATPSVTQQITNFLAAGGTFGPNDVVVINGGFSDIIAEMGAVRSGAQTGEVMLANVGREGRELAAQVRRLVQAGAKYVLVTGVVNLGITPWATSIGQNLLLSQASGKFNAELVVSLVDQGSNALYLDAAFFYNLMNTSPSNYGFTNANSPVCNSIDPGPGIGIGPGNINSSLCTPATVGGQDYSKFVYADAVYSAPTAHRQFGDYAYGRLRGRF
ncbi:MAG: SGNH/GDSL hydrolase family protein [Bdellovibrionales bacterium]|nr:SGNH/GDSL hydrolase family protein [Ramlibacter sp.]